MDPDASSRSPSTRFPHRAHERPEADTNDSSIRPGGTARLIARGLDSDGVKTSQGGRRWWASTVRAVLIRSNPPETAQASAASA